MLLFGELALPQQLAQGLDLATAIGHVGGFIDGAPQRLAVTHQGILLLDHTGMSSQIACSARRRDGFGGQWSGAIAAQGTVGATAGIDRPWHGAASR